MAEKALTAVVQGGLHTGRLRPPPAGALHVGRVDPKIRPVPLNRSIEEGLHLVVDLLAQPAHLAVGDAAHSHDRRPTVVRPPRAARAETATIRNYNAAPPRNTKNAPCSIRA